MYPFALPNLIPNRNLIINPNLNSVQNSQHLILPTNSILSSNSIQSTTQITKNVDQKIITRVVKFDPDKNLEHEIQNVKNEINSSLFDKNQIPKSENENSSINTDERQSRSGSSSPDLMIISQKRSKKFSLEAIKRSRNRISEKLFKNQNIKKERKLNPRMIIPKTTKQMNNELLMESDPVDDETNGSQIDESLVESTILFEQANDLNKDSLDLDSKDDLKRQQKMKAIVKPTQVLNQHNKKLEDNCSILKSNKPNAPIVINLRSDDKANKNFKRFKSDTLVNLSDHSTNETKNQKSNSNNSVESNVVYLNRGIYRWLIDEAFEFVKVSSGIEMANQLKKLKFDGFSLAFLDFTKLKSEDLGFEIKLGPFLILNEKIESYKKISKLIDENEYLPECGANISKWSINDVKNFVNKLCIEADYGKAFEEAEIGKDHVSNVSKLNNSNFSFFFKNLSRWKFFKFAFI